MSRNWLDSDQAIYRIAKHPARPSHAALLHVDRKPIPLPLMYITVQRMRLFMMKLQIPFIGLIDHAATGIQASDWAARTGADMSLRKAA
jgi:hypothetical protein